MHDSAFKIGELVMQTYCDLPAARILEIGSMDVNGSLREAAKPTTQYVGVDLEEGPAVDVLVKPGDKLPFDDSSFDLIMASSAFEHDPRFWDTFIEMCRVARVGGHIYVNAPSNGGVHRYPLDCWRFYPDAGLALVEHAEKNEVQIDLVESFIGKRYTDSWDGWNDFVAVFRRGPSKAPLNKNFVYKRYPSYNARTWNSSEMDCETPLTEDMQLGRDLRQQVADQAVKVDSLQQDRIEGEKLREKLATDLRISEIEASNLRSSAASLEQQVKALSNSLQVQADTVARLVKERIETQKIRDSLAADLRIARSEISQLRTSSASLEQQVHALSGSLQAQTDAFTRIQERDLGVISALESELARLRTREADLEAAVNSKAAQHDRDRSGMEWLRALHIAMAGRPVWWSLLPSQSRRQKEFKMLRDVGLFDDRAYLLRYADVAVDGIDALDHYVTHGMREGRDRI